LLIRAGLLVKPLYCRLPGIPHLIPFHPASLPYWLLCDMALKFNSHITDHEDNEMMRPTQFVPNVNAVRTYIQGIDY